MSGKNMCFLIRSAILIIAACGGLVVCFWYPFSLSLTVTGAADCFLTPIQKAEFWSQLIFYWITSLPCFAILCTGWKISTSVKNNTVFSAETAHRLNRCGNVLFIDLAVFSAGNIVLLLLELNAFALLYFMTAAIGFATAVMCKVFSQIAEKAAEQKNELESFI